MAKLTMTLNWNKRPAIYRPNKYRVVKYELPEGAEVPVEVLGIFQCADDDEVGPVFVVELPNGKCDYAAITEIQFTDKEEPYADDID